MSHVDFQGGILYPSPFKTGLRMSELTDMLDTRPRVSRCGGQCTLVLHWCQAAGILEAFVGRNLRLLRKSPREI